MRIAAPNDRRTRPDAPTVDPAPAHRSLIAAIPDDRLRIHP
jgi:hypothetical protein